MSKALSVFRDNARHVEKMNEEKEKMNEQKEQEAAEQALVVDSLADSLKKLSEGDLTAQIESTFTGNYEQLRLDFNSAAANLRPNGSY